MRLFLLILTNLFVFSSQGSFYLSGYIYDATSLEPLVGANIIHIATLAGTVSNAQGYYQLIVEEGNTNIKVSYVGYERIDLNFELSSDSLINFYLNPVTLDEIIITDSSLPDLNTSSLIIMPVSKTESLPSLAGEADVLKTLTLMPGVSSGIEGSTGLNVRGGSPDQNLILLDGAPVYNVSHLFGFVSVFNADAIKNVELLKGAFPARYGGRLSSVINIAMKEGNKKRATGEVTAGIISSRLTLEVPLKKERTSLMISGRSAYLDLATLPQRIMYKKGSKDMLISYSMLDGNVKIHHLLKNDGSISISHYSGHDTYVDRYRDGKFLSQESSLDWGNITNTFRYNQILNRKLFIEAISYHTQYSYENTMETRQNKEVGEQRITNSSKSMIRDYSGKMGVGYTLNHHQFYGGLHYTYHEYNPSANKLSNTSEGDPLGLSLTKDVWSSAHETAVFIEDEWSVSEKLVAHLGLRHSSIFLQSRTFSGLEPRLSFGYSASPRLRLNASYSFMRQYIHQLTSNTVSLSNDIWVPVTPLAPPQRSWNTTLGLDARFDASYHGTVELFYKQMDNLIDYREGEDLVQGFNEDWDELVEKGGNGEAYGLEIYLQKKVGKMTGWVSYTLSWNNRQFENINEGKRYPYRYDRRHNLALVGNYQLNEEWSVSGNWVFTTGYAVTAPVSRYFTTTTLLAYGTRNNARMPPYHRMDFSFQKSKTTKNNNRASWSLGVYNVYMRRNPLYLKTFNHGLNRNPERGQQIFTDIYGPAYFIFIPSVSYTLKF